MWQKTSILKKVKNKDLRNYKPLSFTSNLGKVVDLGNHFNTSEGQKGD